MPTMLDAASTVATILVVDDNLNNLRLLSKMLAAEGFNVRKALSGQTALQGIYRNAPDLILLDINMPEMSGYEVCQQLKASETTTNIPIIFISALDEVHDKVQAFELGGHDYITKPFQELEVLARIKNQLLIQQQRQQLIQQQRQLLEHNQQLAHEIKERQAAEAEVKRLNVDLERRVQARTLELQQSLNFEAALKRISDKVRDSLDQHQILQHAVDELAQALEVQCCDSVLYSPDHKTAVVRYQYVAPGEIGNYGQLLHMAEAPEVYDQMQQKQLCFAFCQMQPDPTHNHFAILACPMFDEQVDDLGILGDLWLFKPTFSAFSEMEIHLVQQVANQCAIALRQARLYEAAQAQVQELQRLNQLKDDFLSTISHELRTPIATMKMALQMLGAVSAPDDELAPDGPQRLHNRKVDQYLQILRDECDREMHLVEDLLTLQHIEAGTFSNQQTAIDLHNWVLHLIEPFEHRTQNQQQILNINLAPELPTLILDSLSLSRIITELLNNALKYTPRDETITVSVSVVGNDEISTGTFLRLQVTNTGVEIAPQELPRVFDKFYRVPNNDPWKYGGTGLGLALVKKLVEQMKGSIQVESSSNRTCFTVLVPISP